MSPSELFRFWKTDAARPASGEMGQRFEATDWALTPLGPVDSWPASLRTSVSICLLSRFPILLWWGPELVMIYNDAYRPMLGQSKHPSAFGAPGKEVWPEVWDVIGPMLDSVMRGNEATWSADQLLVLDRNGYLEECYFTFSYSPIPLESGEVGGVFCAVTETTEQVLGERRLATLTELSSRLREAETVTEVVSATVEVLGANHRDHPFVALAIAPDDETGPPAVDAETLAALDPPVREALEDVVRDAVVTGTPARREVSQADEPGGPGGTAMVATLHASPIRLPGARTPYAVLVVGRSPHRKWDPALASYVGLCLPELRTALTGLHERATERRRAESLAALDEAKTAFFTNISHELRTPLTLIAGPVQEALADPGITDKHRKRLEIIERNMTRLARMVDALLDFERMEAGRVTPQPTRLDIAKVTQGLAASFSHAVDRAGLEFHVDCDIERRVAMIDRDMYERILLNLLTNSLKYTMAGSISLSLRAAAERFSVSVTDTGVGIAADDLDRVFQRFEQLPRQAGARSREGAGIGLAMVKQLTELMGGEVAVDSRPGVGSTFTIDLPWVSPAAGPDAGRSITPRHVEAFLTETEGWDVPPIPAPRQAKGNGAWARSRGGARGRLPRLLVAEDNADMRAYLVDTLSAEYSVDAVSDGEVAMEAIRAVRPDIVLTDAMMPRLDGFDLVRTIREDPHLADLPVIILSARAAQGDAATGLESGADDYLTKPFTIAELQARLSSNLERSRARLRDAAWRRTFMAGFHDPLLITDEDENVVEFNQAFTDLLGWSMQDGPFEAPHPWSPAEEGDAGQGPHEPDGTVESGATASDTPVDKPSGTQPTERRLRTRDGQDVWVTTSHRLVEGVGDQPSLVVHAMRDVTREHRARERRRAAVALSAEFGGATDLTQVLSAAVAGFAELFDGDSTIRALAGTEDNVFTASGPVRSSDLDPGIWHQLSSRVEAPLSSIHQPVTGLLLVPENPQSDCRVWVQFPRPRLVTADEHIVGDLLAQAFALAVDRVVAVTGFADREQHLAKAIESHRMIGQAIGILIERHRITSADAFTMLKKASQERNIKLREIAARVIETGAEPGDAD